jgi:hypothetical protein
MIQIQQPEIEALIQHRLTTGGFENVEEVLLQALQDAPLRSSSAKPTGLTGLAIVEAFQRSPHKEIDIFPESHVLPVSEPVEF